ncbi:MAG: ATP-binding protein [Paracoccaceae bacterium]
MLRIACRAMDAFAELQGRDDAADLSHAEWLGLPIDREASNRSTKKFQSRMRTAKLRHVGASIEDVDYRTPRKLDSEPRCAIGSSGVGEHCSRNWRSGAGSRTARTCSSQAHAVLLHNAHLAMCL